jgi:hypothetical protein
MAASPAPRPSRPIFAHWVIAFFLGVIAACLLLRTDVPFGSMALAQPSTLAGARGVFAFTGQISKDRYGVFMVDVDQGTIWCYELTGNSRLDLVSGRLWRYDRYLEEFNIDEPSPIEVERMVEQQRRARAPVTPPTNPPPSLPQEQQVPPDAKEDDPSGAP